MIVSFQCLDTRALFQSIGVARFANIERTARRKLLMLHAAPCLHSLRVPPGTKLEALRGDRKGQHSIRINDQWRIFLYGLLMLRMMWKLLIITK